MRRRVFLKYYPKGSVVAFSNMEHGIGCVGTVVDADDLGIYIHKEEDDPSEITFHPWRVVEHLFNGPNAQSILERKRKTVAEHKGAKVSTDVIVASSPEEALSKLAEKLRNLESNDDEEPSEEELEAVGSSKWGKSTH